MSYTHLLDGTPAAPFVLRDFLQALELQSHAEYATPIANHEYSSGAISLLLLNWLSNGNEQETYYYGLHGQPSTFDILSDEDKQKRLDVEKSIKILKKDGEEVLHITTRRSDVPPNQELDKYMPPEPVFEEPELVIVGNTPEQLEAHTQYIRTLLQSYFEYYNSLPTTEFIPKVVKRYPTEVVVEADGVEHPLFDSATFPIPHKEHALAAD